MPRLMINDRSVDVSAGCTVLQAAREQGIEIPNLCFLEGLRPNTSCMLCVVEIDGRTDLVPSCAAAAEEGMRVRTDTPAVIESRRVTLELLLSSHVGDCCAPCQHTCPLHLDIPQMLRRIAEGDLTGAEATVRAAMALPAVLSRVCPHLCEKTCRRGIVDRASAICELKRYVSDRNHSGTAVPWPDRRPLLGRRVAVVGGGPTGLSAAYHLLLEGYKCVIFERLPTLGGRLRVEFDDATLPGEVIDAEIALIEQLGAEVRLHATITDTELPVLCEEFNAVLIAVGRLPVDATDCLGLPVGSGRVRTRPHSFETEVSRVFVAGNALRPSEVVRCVAEGKSAAESIDRSLRGLEGAAPRPYFARTGHVTRDELVPLVVGDTDRREGYGRAPLAPAPALAEVQAEAASCLQCDCAARDRCRLRAYAERYGVAAHRLPYRRRPIERIHSGEGLIFEPGKCILCGICVQIAEDAEEPIGLSFAGRGIDLHLAVPFGKTLTEGLTRSATRCVETCPTGALAFRCSAVECSV